MLSAPIAVFQRFPTPSVSGVPPRTTADRGEFESGGRLGGRDVQLATEGDPPNPASSAETMKTSDLDLAYRNLEER